MIEGAQWRRYQDWERAAWVTAHLLNASGKTMKKKIQPDELLGKQKNRPARNLEADFQEILRRQEAIDASKAN